MFPGHKPFWWEEFLEIQMTDRNAASRNNRLALYHEERKLIVARGDSILELNELATKYLDNLFERFVLSAE